MFGDGVWVGDCEGESVGFGGDAGVAGMEVDEVEGESAGCACEGGEEGEGFVCEHSRDG